MLKGDVKAGDLIDFYEISFFSKAATGQVTYFDVSPFNPMQPGREYIVFAKKIIFHPAYQARLERDVYRAVSLEASYFLPEITEPPILDESETIYFQNVKENEFNCYSKEQRDAINRREKGDPFQAKSSNGIEKFDRKTRPAEASISSPPALLACSSVHVIKMMRGGRCISCLARFCGIKGISFDPTGQLSAGCHPPSGCCTKMAGSILPAVFPPKTWAWESGAYAACALIFLNMP